MLRRIPPAFRRSPSSFFSHFMAGIAAAPLLLASVAADEMHEFFEKLEIVALVKPAAAPAPTATGTLAITSGIRAPATEKPAVTLPLEAPAEFSDLMLAHDQSAFGGVSQSASLAIPTAIAREPETAGAGGEALTLALPQPEFMAALPPELLAPPRAEEPRVIPRVTIAAIPESEIQLIKAAAAEYRKGALKAGDEIAAKAQSETARLALEWIAIRTAKQQAGFTRLAKYAFDNPDMPMVGWIESRAADALFVQKVSPDRVRSYFADRKPETSAAKIALGRALAASGNTAEAHALIRGAFRDDKTNAALRNAIQQDFPGLITAADQRYLAERLIYEGQTSAGLAVAAKSGPNVQQLAQLLAASINETRNLGTLLAKLDLGLRNEPAALFARAQNFRRTGKFVDAAQTLLSAPNDLDRIVDGDEWWIERRMLARKLLDTGETKLAYRVTAAHQAEGAGHRVDAEVHAGWIALRFLDDPALAASHFAKAAAAATTPPSISRAAYWQGRAAEAMDDPFASEFHATAAHHSHTFYGQLSLARIGQAILPEKDPSLDEDTLRAAAANRGLRVIRALLDADARDFAQPLIFDAAKRAEDMEQIVVLGDLLAQYRLPKLTLQAGKIALSRGMFSEEHAFPTFGIPQYEAAPQSAESAIVYSIARQESEFDAAVVSHAGARGLMQLMPATARRTADRQKIPLDVNQLTTNPSLNAKIGAAHLAELFGEYNGSYILSFAAYNAGGRRVREWTTAYGDPRDPNVDKVDWIERIPITETRDYVKKILENVQVYRARLYGQRDLGITQDLVRGARLAKAPASSTE